MNDIGASENPSNTIPLADSKFNNAPESGKKKLWIGAAIATVLIGAGVGIGVAVGKHHGGGNKPDPGPNDNDLLNGMLGSTPLGVGGKETLLWESMNPLTQETLADYLDQATESNHVDMWTNGVIYSEWTGGNCGDGWGPIGNNTATCYGMRFPEGIKNGAKHGIVRTEWYNGTVEEGTWYSENEGDPSTKWGLTRLIDDGRVFIQFFKDGALHFQSTFDRNFVELDRMYEEEFRDEYFMQDIAPFKFSKEPISSKDMLDLVLASRPVHLGSIQDAMWSRFIDIDVAFFESFWELPGEEMITWDEVVYDEWTSAETIVEGSHEVIMRNYGTRSKAEGAIQSAGLVRQVAFNDFRQLTYTMEGQKNGMSIGVAAAVIPEIGQQVEGQVVFHTPAEEGKAQVTFSWMFNELSRTDPEKLLTTVEPKQLQLDEGDALLKMLRTTPRYGDNFATRVWMDQAPLIDKLQLGWDRLNLTDSIGPILKTDGRFYDSWNETNPLTQVYETLEGVRSIDTELANGIMRRTNPDNIVEGYVIEEQVEGAPIHREFWGLTRTIFKDGNTRIELHGDDFATGEHTLLAEFEFDQYYVEDEAARFDKHGYFHDVTADDFRTFEMVKPQDEGFMK